MRGNFGITRGFSRHDESPRDVELREEPPEVAETIDKIFGDDLHALRVLSIANGVVGVLHAAVLSIHAIGRGYAHATTTTRSTA